MSKVDDQLQIDTAMLAHAYLAEHPADDAEPVTPEWLESAGFELGDVGDAHYASLSLWGLGTMPDYLEANWEGSVMFHSEIKTRGDVRRLCAALGVELEEQNERKRCDR